MGKMQEKNIEVCESLGVEITPELLLYIKELSRLKLCCTQSMTLKNILLDNFVQDDYMEKVVDPVNYAIFRKEYPEIGKVVEGLMFFITAWRNWWTEVNASYRLIYNRETHIYMSKFKTKMASKFDIRIYNEGTKVYLTRKCAIKGKRRNKK